MDSIHRIKGRISNIYLINDAFICIVDSGSPNDFPLIKEAIVNKLGRSMNDVDFIVPTHSHIEHMGNAPKLKRRTGGKIILPRGRINPTKGVFDNLGFLKKMPRAIISGVRNNPSLLLYGHLHFQRLKADRVSHDGMELPGHPGWRIIFTPGHSPESVCLQHRESGSLLSGDTVINIDGKASLPFGIWDREIMKKTVERLLDLGISSLYPGHGEPMHGAGILDSLRY